MGRLTVDQLMAAVAATVNQDATTPTDGGSEWTLWLSYINRSQNEWAEANDWEELRKIYYPTVTGVSTATMTLPLDWKKPAGPALIFDGSSTNYPQGRPTPEVLIENIYLHLPTDRYFTIMGNISNGYSMIWNPGTLASGASIQLTYFSIPTSLASPADIPVVSDSQFIIDRTISYIFEARSDPRFQQQEVKAREKLLQMIDNANMMKYTSYAGPSYVPNGPLQRLHFRMGRD